MNVIAFNLICYLIEFAKLFLVARNFFHIKQSKRLYLFTAISLLPLGILSSLIDSESFTPISCVVLVLLFIMSSSEKRKSGLVVLSFLGICIIDLFFSCICIFIFHLDENTVMNNYPINIGLNSISLLFFLLISLFLYQKHNKKTFFYINKYLPLQILSIFILSVFFTAIQCLEMGMDTSIFRSRFSSSLILCGVVVIIIMIIFNILANRNEHLNHEVSISKKLLETQKSYFSMLLEKEHETKAFRHDIKNHLFCMSSLYQNGKYEELGTYLADLSHNVEVLSPKIQTGNELVGAIANDLARRYPQVTIQWEGLIPAEINLSSLDTCTIFYNLLSNAFEAAQNVPDGEVHVIIKFLESTMLFTIENSAQSAPKIKHGEFVSHKNEIGHGFGVKNAKQCIEEKNGHYSYEYQDGIFTTDVYLPGIQGIYPG